MDVIEEFLEKQPVSGKVKISLFIQESEAITTKMSYDIPTLNALELRKFWKHLLDKCQQSFICGYSRNKSNSQAEDVEDDVLITKLSERSVPVDEVTTWNYNSQKDCIYPVLSITELLNTVNFDILFFGQAFPASSKSDDVTYCCIDEDITAEYY
ncbi:hypothetical protein BDF20DRAFT_916126 [Mycotypha africana]|uniref:uncharacterized protein n=1 Tax=Mycotypha africana TaxID=64632 RepID=UPI0023011C43|nr:uncharacterized protein BDF20DRAFT_916126 [Mycotypha africana]KAI8970305.1 hypothetical protein BDF20DRAFT_916126 [Mycotypha africana]